MDAALPLGPADHNALVTNPNGYVPLQETLDSDVLLPTEIMGAGHHFHDVDRGFRRNQTLRDLPRQLLHNKVVDSHLVRPSVREANRCT